MNARELLNYRLRGEVYALVEPPWGFPTEKDKLRFKAECAEKLASFREDLEEVFGTNVLPPGIRKEIMDRALKESKVRLVGLPGKPQDPVDITVEYRRYAILFMETYEAGALQGIKVESGQS